MSPEQTRGDEVDHRTDIWSLCVVLYEMLTGQLPFKGDYEQAIIYSILNEEPVPISNYSKELPSQLWQIIKYALSKDPENRYQKMDELLADLTGLRNQPHLAKAQPFLRKRDIKQVVKNPLLYFFIPICIILLLTFFSIYNHLFKIRLLYS